MRALVYDPDAPKSVRLDTVAEPRPTASQVMVRVEAMSLNSGEVRYLGPDTPVGAVLGWDAAGAVVESAADGSGPAVGTRVVTSGWGGGWAELRAVETDSLAVLPDSVDCVEASALPVAAVTALQALRRLGPVVGRRVLITGASGGVGRFAVQLAARAGAEVVAAVGSPDRGRNLRELGATVVVYDLDLVTEPVFGVLENVGGQQLAKAFALVEPGGVVQSIGMASGRATTIDFEAERHRGRGRGVETFVVRTPFPSELTYLVQLLAAGALDPQVGWRGDWTQAAEAIEALLRRQVAGKAVLTID